MFNAERLKAIRKHKNMSQGDIERRTGLLHRYILRVENGPTVPAIETLEKLALAMEVPPYALFYDGEKPPVKPDISKLSGPGWGSSGRDVRTFERFRRLMSRLDKGEQKLLLLMARKMTAKNCSV